MQFKISSLVIPVLVFGCLFIGGLFTMAGMDWYNTDLLLSPLTPPSWVFRIVWSIIGVCTIFSLLIVWNKLKRDALFSIIIALFACNGFLNVTWTYLFFYAHALRKAIWAAVAIEVSLVMLILLLCTRSYRAALLLVPYALWVLFAIYLNYDIWLINEAL